MGEPTKEQIEKLGKLADKRKVWLGWNDDLSALLSAYEERGREVEEWRSRFKAIVDEDRPDSAGNAVLRLMHELKRLRSMEK